MLLIPAIDMKDGQCVRLKQGDMDQTTVFGEDPAAMARSWVDKGARRIHLVDLNGAFAGKPKNEQAMVHAAAGYARMHLRLRTLACTSSIGPGATNMITAAAGATINRLPVLLLPGDLFATRRVGTVLQQLESEHGADVSVNDCFRPVSRYWDRLNRPEQLPAALLEAMRVLTSPAETGAAR